MRFTRKASEPSSTSRRRDRRENTSPIFPRLPEQSHLAFSEALDEARTATPWDEEVDIATGALSGPIVPPDRGLDWVADMAVERVTDDWDFVIAWTGEERVSKSTGMLRLNQKIAERTGRPFDFDNFCYGGRALNAAYRRAHDRHERFVQLDYDEASRGALAGETFKTDQVVISQLLMNAGVVGVVLQLCIPDIWALAKKIRGRRAVLWAYVATRGTRRKPAPSRAILHERVSGVDYTHDSSLRLWVSRRCPEFTFEPFAADDPFWVKYLAVKNRNLDALFDENDLALDRHELKEYGTVLGRRSGK